MKQESGATTSGGITYYQYYHVGPAEQLGAFGWGISLWGGTFTRCINNYFKWSIMLIMRNGRYRNYYINSHNRFSNYRYKLLQVGTEEISYTGLSGNNLTGITRAVRGSTAAHQ